MKKFLVVTIGVVLIAAACNKAAVQPAPAPAGGSTSTPSTPTTSATSFSGKLIDGGAECQLFQSDDGKQYALTGDLAGFKTGDAVKITGTLPAVSTCQQGDGTINITTITKSDAVSSTSTSTSTSDWKTYTNTQYGYSIGYPDVVQATAGTQTDRLHDISLGGNGDLLITVHDLASDYSAKHLQYTDKTINAVSVKYNQSYDSNNNLVITALFTSKQFVYELRFTDDHNSTKVDLFNQVLATFKFTK